MNSAKTTSMTVGVVLLTWACALYALGVWWLRTHPRPTGPAAGAQSTLSPVGRSHTP